VRSDENAPTQSVFDRSMAGGRLAGGYIEGVSFSGNERNNLFVNLAAKNFQDVSGISGIDHPADGRSMSMLDYDRDGWTDLAIVNANSPLFQLYRNKVKEIVGERPVLAIRLVGGNRTSSASETWAARDGYGAVVEVKLGEERLVREHRAGEGMASQNSRTLLFGLGADAEGAAIQVRWPSGNVQELDFAAAGSLVTVYEDASEAADGKGFMIAPYRVEGLAARAAAAQREESPGTRLAIAGPEGRGNTKARLKIVTTMATWCDACKGELPQLKKLRKEFANDDLELLGVPADEDDTEAMLEEYVATYKPAYTMLSDLSDAEVNVVKQAVIDALRIDALPAAIITDSNGRVLRTLWEAPSVSEVRELLGRTGA